jgi:glucosamine--fructose-6-phosphate aminotransferase (isomerizing)
MCGITLINSLDKHDVVPALIQSLEQLQNRGYDSVGIAYHTHNNNNNQEIEIKKYASTNQVDCFDILNQEWSRTKFSAISAIGHTRWATHGARNTTNAHPHYSHDRTFALVHNGIIENYAELRVQLSTHGIKSYSETDSEVVANMIAFNLLKQTKQHYTETIAIERAIIETCRNLSGTYALGIIFSKCSDTIYAIRNGSPLVYAQNSEFQICTSEIAGFDNRMTNYTTLENGVLYRIGNNTSSNLTACATLNERLDGANLLENQLHRNITPETVTKGDYTHFTEREIFEQPESILRALNNGGRITGDEVKLGGLTSLVQSFPNRLEIDHVIILGCGTSMHAAMIGANYILNNCSFASVNYYDASEFDGKNISTKGQTLVILCSQSGETRDLCEKIPILRKSNCITVGVINQVDSQIASAVDFGVYLNAGREIGVASTKSFTSMVVVLSLISLFFSRYFNKINPVSRSRIINAARNLPNSVKQLLENPHKRARLDQIAEWIHSNTNTCNQSSLFILGKSNYFAVAREISLKIKEICYIHAEGFSGSALKHGPFALLHETSQVILIITKNTATAMRNCFEEINSRGANITVFTDCANIAETLITRNPVLRTFVVDCLEYYGEINICIALQYLAYKISCLKGINPDKPRNLAKVVTVQ